MFFTVFFRVSRVFNIDISIFTDTIDIKRGDYMSFGERLKEARLLKGYTQKQLGEKLNIAGTTITGYEKDNSEPSMLVISKIMNVLDIDANFLFQDVTQDHIFENSSTPEEFENIIKKYRNLDDEGRKLVNHVLAVEVKRSKDLLEARESAKKRLLTYEKNFKKIQGNKSQTIYSTDFTQTSMVAESSTPYGVNAAHERTDIEVTDEMCQHNNDIMNDDSEWE
jgi:transcriptional regulator with XRE-family HTH domain